MLNSFQLECKITAIIAKGQVRCGGKALRPVGPKCARCLPGNEAACPTGCARPGHRAAGPGPRRPWSLPQERNSPGRYRLDGAYPKEPSISPTGRGSKQRRLGGDGGNGGFSPDLPGSANRGRG